MKPVNTYHLLSETISAGMGNTGTQTEAVANLFVNGLFGSENLLTVESVEGGNGTEYHLDFDGFSAHGPTPALALSKILNNMAAEISGYRHGTP